MTQLKRVVCFLFSLFSLKPTLNWCLWQERASIPRGRTLSGRPLPSPWQVEVGRTKAVTSSAAAAAAAAPASPPRPPPVPLFSVSSQSYYFYLKAYMKLGREAWGGAQGEEGGGL